MIQALIALTILAPSLTFSANAAPGAYATRQFLFLGLVDLC